MEFVFSKDGRKWVAYEKENEFVVTFKGAPSWFWGPLPESEVRDQDI